MNAASLVLVWGQKMYFSPLPIVEQEHSALVIPKEQ